MCTRIVGGVGCQGWRYYVGSYTTTIYDQWLFSAPVVIFFLFPQAELVGDDTIAVWDKKESVVLRRREKKLVVMLAADGRYGSRCVCVCVCMRVCVCVRACAIACTSII